MRLVRCTVAAVAVISLSATPALAQVDVRVKVDTKAVKEVAQDLARELREAIHTAFGPEFRRDIQHAVRDVSGAIEDLATAAWESGEWGQAQRFRAEQTDRETRRFAIGANGQLDLDTLSGNVTIRRGSSRELVVEVVREARGATDAAVKMGLAEVKAVSEERGGRVTIKAVYPNQRGRSQYSVSVNYIVSAPAGTRISSRSISGDVSADGIDGELTLTTMSGDVQVTNATRLTSATTASGDITLTNVAADSLLEASTMSGDVAATGVKARRLSLGSVSGSVTARGIDAGDVKLTTMSDDVVFEGALAPRGRYEFSSHSGDVHIILDGQTGFSFDGSAFSGSVRSSLPLQGSRPDPRSGTGRRTANNRTLNGTFGDGSAVIDATSFSGSVILTKK